METTKNTTTILCSTGGDQYGEHWTFRLSKEAQNLGRELSKNSEWGSGNVNSFEFRTDATLIKVFRTIGWRIAKNSSKPSFSTRGAKLRTYEYENRFLNFDLSDPTMDSEVANQIIKKSLEFGSAITDRSTPMKFSMKGILYGKEMMITKVMEVFTI